MFFFAALSQTAYDVPGQTHRVSAFAQQQRSFRVGFLQRRSSDGASLLMYRMTLTIR